MVKVGEKETYLYNQDELAAFTTKHEKKSDKPLDVTEFYEARELEKVAEQIKKQGVDLNSLSFEKFANRAVNRCFIALRGSASALFPAAAGNPISVRADCRHLPSAVSNNVAIPFQRLKSTAKWPGN